MLFVVLAVAAQLDRDYIREKTLEGQLAAAARGNHGGRPKVVDPDMAIFARALRDQGTPMPDIAQKLKIQSGKNAGKHPSVASLYRALADAQHLATRPQTAPPTCSRSAHGGYWAYLGCTPWSIQRTARGVDSLTGVESYGEHAGKPEKFRRSVIARPARHNEIVRLAVTTCRLDTSTVWCLVRGS